MADQLAELAHASQQSTPTPSSPCAWQSPHKPDRVGKQHRRYMKRAATVTLIAGPLGIGCYSTGNAICMTVGVLLMVAALVDGAALIWLICAGSIGRCGTRKL